MMEIEVQRDLKMYSKHSTTKDSSRLTVRTEIVLTILYHNDCVHNRNLKHVRQEKHEGTAAM
jgi:hypothetical protein